MTDIPDFVVLTVAGIFFVIAVVVGVCLYYRFFRLRNDSGPQGRRYPRQSFKLNCGLVNPFEFYMMGTAPVDISGPPPFMIEVNDENKSTSRSVLKENPLKLSDKMAVCRSLSYEKPFRSPCHLQVIQETEEDDDDKTEEVNNDCKF